MKRLIPLFFLLASLASAQGLINGARGFPQPNDTVTGTTLAGTAIVNPSGNAINASTTNTNLPTYIVLSPTSIAAGNAILANQGAALCTMDSTIASGAGNFYVINSTTVAKQCHAQSAVPPYGTWVIGFLHDASTVSGSTALVDVSGFFVSGGGTIGSASAGVYAYLTGITFLGPQFALYAGPGSSLPSPSGSNTTGWGFPCADNVSCNWDGTAFRSSVSRGGSSGAFSLGHLVCVGSPFYNDTDCGVAGIFMASLTTTAAASDNVTLTGMTSSGHCEFSPTNASAATNIATTYISAKTTNQITVTHTATSGMTYDIICTGN